MKIIIHILILWLLFPVFANAQIYTTDFTYAENPLSEGGRWNNGGSVGLDWTNVKTISGIVCGTQTGSDTGYYQYNDSYAILSGFPPDQTSEGIVQYRNPASSCNQEVELLLRWNSVAHIAKGYECLFRCLDSSESYMEIVRWNGPLGDFTYLARMHNSSAGIKSGDRIKASIAGSVITVYVNGAVKLQCTDSTYTEGNPGMGFFLHGCPGSNTDFGFTRFTARGKQQ